MPIFWALVGTPTTRAWMVINPLEDSHYGMASSLPSVDGIPFPGPDRPWFQVRRREKRRSFVDLNNHFFQSQDCGPGRS